MGIIIDFLKLPLKVKMMLPEAMLLSAKFRYQILHEEFKNYAPEIGTFKYETPVIRIGEQCIEDTAWAVHAACSRVKWDSKCLDQALTAKKMLNKRGLPCTLYMGLKMDEKNEMSAHAWLRCGDRFVTGGNGAEYAVTAIYGDKIEKKTRVFAISESTDKNKQIAETDSLADGYSWAHTSPAIDFLKDAKIRCIQFPVPDKDKMLHLYIHEGDLEQASAIMKKNDCADVILHKELPSEFQDRFNVFWKRSKDITIGEQTVTVLSDVDHLCYLLGYKASDNRQQDSIQALIRKGLKSQTCPMDSLYNRAKARSVQNMLLKALISLYQEDSAVKKYDGAFLTIERTEKDVLVTYDSLLERELNII